MSAMSPYLKEKLLNHTLRSTSYSSPGTVYIALFETDPDSGGVELVGSGYTRKAVAFNAPSSGTVTNNGNVVFDTATANWNTINYVALVEDSSGGEVLYSTQLATPIDIDSGNNLQVDDTNLSVQL